MADLEAKDIIEQTDMVSLVEKYGISLRKQGKNYFGLCPFHNDSNPSFSVSPDKHLAKCFTCKSGGNPIEFIMQIENVGYGEAKAKLAEFNGISYKFTAKPKKEDPLKRYYSVVETAKDFYKKNLELSKQGIQAKEYLKNRGIDDELIKIFQIGLAPQVGDTLYQVLKAQDYPEIDILKVGLIGKNVNGYYDFFSNRIMFPIFNSDGDAVGFSARLIEVQPGQNKYLNSTDNIVYNKSQILYNLHIAKQEIRKKKRIILHEGQMDVIASYKSDLKEAVCAMGTALTPQNIQQIKKYTTNIVICYDGDNAGIEASKKAIVHLKNEGFTVHLVLLPDKMDPDEYVKKFGKEAYKEYFESHLMDDNQYLYEVAIQNKNFLDSTVVEEVKREVFNIVFTIESAIVREKYLNMFAQKLGSSFESVCNDYNSFIQSNNVNNAVEYPVNNYYDDYHDQYDVVTPQNIHNWKSISEIRLFQYAKASKTKAEYIDMQLGDSVYGFSPDNQNLWFKLINEYYMTYDTFNESYFIKMLNTDQMKHYTDMISVLGSPENLSILYTENDLFECILKIKELYLNQIGKSLFNEVNQSDDEETKIRLAELALQNKKKKTQLENSRRKK